MNDKVLDFIEIFNEKGDNRGVIECFTCGCCYWFAHILFTRFLWETDRIDIVYDEVENHFGCRINDEVYDITGNVTNEYYWESWKIVANRDSLLADRILRDCIRKEKTDEQEAV